MTPLELLLAYLTFAIGLGSYFGTNDKLAVPYKTFQNSYLKIEIKQNFNNHSVDNQFHKANFGLRALSIVSPLFINPINYPINFKKDVEQLKKHFKSLPYHIAQNPSEYFLENCDYITRLPTDVGFEISIGVYSLTDFIKLMPNQTLVIKIESINGELYPESKNSKSYEIVPTPPDIGEVQKCNFEIEANNK